MSVNAPTPTSTLASATTPSIVRPVPAPHGFTDSPATPLTGAVAPPIYVPTPQRLHTEATELKSQMDDALSQDQDDVLLGLVQEWNRVVSERDALLKRTVAEVRHDIVPAGDSDSLSCNPP